ncbi:2OG-Fe dioxygenase family protein [Streptomyces sp. NBC_01761]|uniref:2OG-Fe dioxygenase family protein n=1 Tax=Streptomyces sp. NBC_01761 TaxID=2975932 RepID=UPI002DD8A261|nr:2OG-Fe dioxygenase family protein [Streptomyces sp. NBC_01761]WSC55852.1 2OG-Fe dioxygenase family protein [Streptomyces sp. NBC_01761]
MSAVATIATAPTTATGTTPFRHFSPTLLRRALARHAEWERKEFISSWEDLPVDAYLKGGATFRCRRYSQFHLADGRLVPSGQIVFEQSKEVNSLFGGVQRHFEPLREDVAASALLETVVFTFLDNLPGEIDRSDAAIGVHQIRITANRDEASLPAPEGIHEDGHHFVAQVLINREGVTGGESQLYDRDRSPIFRTTLLEPLESIVIDDRRVFHGVSGVTPAPGVTEGIRDMMLIDFFPLTD